MQASRQLIVNSDANPGLGKVALLKGGSMPLLVTQTIDLSVTATVPMPTTPLPSGKAAAAVRAASAGPTRRPGPDLASGVLETC
jgi:hypothetical protein